MYTKNIKYGLLFFLSFLAYSPANAQTAENRTWLTTHIIVNEVDSDNFNEHFGFRWGNDLGGSIGIRYYLNNNFDAELAFLMSRVDDEIEWTQDYYNPNLLLHYKLANGSLLSEDSFVQPFLSGGVGLGIYRGGNPPNTTGVEVPLGGGIDFAVSRWFSLTTSVLYNFTFNDDIDGDIVPPFITADNTPDNMILYKAGIKFNLGPRDRDGDGVKDRYDVCPNTPGLAEFDGCPDTDRDGIADRMDRCPEVAGGKDTGGCPDSDGDGVINSEDACPNVAGSAEFDGCPDSDNDGIIDSADSCPNIAGTKALNGCPDSDGDGITNNVDDCPNTPGTRANNGCPDSDGDGIIDSEDACPNVSGFAEFDGCPGIGMAQQVADRINNTLVFDFNESTLDSKYHDDLDELAEYFTENSDLRLSISGYTDSIGSREYNERLSQRRADAVKQYLIQQGVSEDQITTSALGEQNPVATNDTEAGRQENRRGKLMVTIDN